MRLAQEATGESPSTPNEPGVRELLLEKWMKDVPSTRLLTPDILRHPDMQWEDSKSQWKLTINNKTGYGFFTDFIYFTEEKDRYIFTIIELKVCHYHKSNIYTYCINRSLKEEERIFEIYERFTVASAKSTDIWLQDTICQATERKETLLSIFQGVEFRLPYVVEAFAVVGVLNDPEDGDGCLRRFDWSDKY